MKAKNPKPKGIENPDDDPASLAEARSKASVLGKLRQAGGKGLSLGKFARKSKKARELLERTLADLEAHQSITRVLTAGRATWYLPHFAPSLESAFGKLERHAAETGGLLLSKADLKAILIKAEVPYLAPALCRLLGEKVLVKLRHLARGKKNGGARETEFYLHRASLQEMTAETFHPETGEGTVSLGAKLLFQTYQGLVQQNGFPDVEIAELRQELGVPMPEVSRQILEERRAGRAVLSFGDWSLASEKTRSGAIEIDGERYLRVRFQS